MDMDRMQLFRKLVDIQYTRNDMDFARGSFRARGDIVDIYPAGGESAVRVEFFGDEIESIHEIDPLTGEITGTRSHISIFPARKRLKNPSGASPVPSCLFPMTVILLRRSPPACFPLIRGG